MSNLINRFNEIIFWKKWKLLEILRIWEEIEQKKENWQWKGWKRKKGPIKVKRTRKFYQSFSCKDWKSSLFNLNTGKPKYQNKYNIIIIHHIYFDKTKNTFLGAFLHFLHQVLWFFYHFPFRKVFLLIQEVLQILQEYILFQFLLIQGDFSQLKLQNRLDP